MSAHDDMIHRMSQEKRERYLRSKTFQNTLSKDPRYELVKGEFQLKPHIVKEILGRNLEFYLTGPGADMPKRNEGLYFSYRALIKLLKRQILKNHCQ